jgi:hypothetical protein
MIVPFSIFALTMANSARSLAGAFLARSWYGGKDDGLHLAREALGDRVEEVRAVPGDAEAAVGVRPFERDLRTGRSARRTASAAPGPSRQRPNAGAGLLRRAGECLVVDALGEIWGMPTSPRSTARRGGPSLNGY